MVKEIISLREFRRRYYELGLERIKRKCKRERPHEYDICVEEKKKELERVVREIRWYQTKLNFITPRTIRLYDEDTGYYIICWIDTTYEYKRGKKYRVLCHAWDPGTFTFKGFVPVIYTCMKATHRYCKRADRSRNIHLEAEYCSEFTIREHGYLYRVDTLQDMVNDLYENFSIAEGEVEKCIECFNVEYEDYYGYSTRFSDVCAYNRCDDHWRVCDKETCTCKTGKEPELVL